MADDLLLDFPFLLVLFQPFFCLSCWPLACSISAFANQRLVFSDFRQWAFSFDEREKSQHLSKLEDHRFTGILWRSLCSGWTELWKYSLYICEPQIPQTILWDFSPATISFDCSLWSCCRRTEVWHFVRLLPADNSQTIPKPGGLSVCAGPELLSS